ncbi:MAG: agmatinase family protein [Bacteroidota bacterium]|nr:agmatinase family protein [Bacteroidota bacterium]MDP4213854.1 agmatinase family protein [Bacteroidota bacterium]MDP4251826.1 agmatinase family protein [Bacteroidota bacterium]
MTNLSNFDSNIASNPKNGIFGLPFTEEDARLIILPVPWEVTVSYGSGTSRCGEHIFNASMQVDLFDPENGNAWKQGIFMRHADRKILMKSDYLRKEAELYIDYISKGEQVEKNNFMCKSLKEINEGGTNLNKWVYEQTANLLRQDKLVVLLGGDHSVPLGYLKAIAEKYGDFAVLQIDAHCDLRKAYENFDHSHASVMYNALAEIPQITRLVQLGVRDYSEEEWNYISNSNRRVVTYFDTQLKERLYEGQTWRSIVDEIVRELPACVYISFDIDGLDPKLCPNTGTPVSGGLEVDQIIYLVKKIMESGRRFIGFDLDEIAVGESSVDANVGARILWKLCNMLMVSNPLPVTHKVAECVTTM